MLVLRDYQSKAIDGLRNGFREGHIRQVLSASTGSGKCHGADTPIMMADGSVKMVQDVRVGDRLLGPDGKIRNVLALARGREKMYRVTPVKGAPYTCNESHILSLRKSGTIALTIAGGTKIEADADVVNVSVRDLLASSSTTRHCLKGWRSSAVEFPYAEKKPLSIPPYILGTWLGDGTESKVAITKPPCKMTDEWELFCKSVGTDVRKEYKNGCVTFHATNGRRGRGSVAPALEMFRAEGLIYNKNIPTHYKTASISDRLELLAGLLDSDGHVSHNGYDWISKSEGMATDLAFIARSVGLACYVTKSVKSIRSLGFSGTYWRCSISGDTDIIPCRDKKASPRMQKKRALVHGIKVDPIGEDDYFGFEIDGDRLYLLGDFTVTHNSVIMLDMVRSAVEKKSRAIFICERRNLIDQFSAHLDREGIDHGVIMAKHWRWRPQSLVQVASAQTLERMETWPNFDVAFIDEVHASMRKSIVTMLETRPKLRVVGATATPFHPLLGKYFTNVVSAPPMVELVGMKNLVPFRVFVAHEIDTDGVKVVAGEWQKDELEDRGRKIVGDIVTDYIQLSQSVFGRRSKAICFSCGIAHGAELVESFAAAGINAIQLASGVDEDFKSDVLRDFAKPDSGIDILISVDMLSRGFDQTDIEHVILARPLKKSFSQHVQMIGRGARSHPGKELCVIQDHCSNWLRFENEWEEFFNNGVKELSDSFDKKPKKEPSKKEKEAAKCPRCGAFWPSGSDKCLHCGLVRRKENTLAAAPGKMQEISGSTQKKEKYSSDYKESFYKGLIGHLRATGKNENRAFYLYREKFGVDPCWKKEPVIPSMDVINYVRRSNIAFAKRRSA